MKKRAHRILALLVAGASAALLAGCVSGPPSLDQVAGEFDDPIEPSWSVDVAGIYGEPTIVGDLIAVYARDTEDGLRLEVHDTETGELLWEHIASPGGAWGAPLFSETESASRPYPIPAIKPFVVTRGEGDEARRVIVFTERVLTETNEIYNPDMVHVVEARSGDELELTAPDFVEFETPYGEAEIDDDGNVLLQAYSPFRLCGDGPTVCTEDANGGFNRIDVGTLEVTNSAPDFDPFQSDYSRDFGAEYFEVLPPDDSDEAFSVARLVDGDELWRVDEDELFGVPGTSPAEKRDFRAVGDLVLIQGYKSILTNLDDHTFEYDYAASRTLVAIDPDTGEVAWAAPGVDSLCFAVDDRPLPREPGTIPVCHATAGSFFYDYDSEEMIDEVSPEVSIAGLDLTDGSITWEAPHAGDQAIMHHARQVESVFASDAAFAVVDMHGEGDDAPGIAVLDLASGDLKPVPEKSGYLCESERPGVDLEFQGSVFVSGSNPIALEYPAGWYQFACDQDGGPAKTWTKGAVRVGGLPAADGRVIVVTEDGLVGFAL